MIKDAIELAKAFAPKKARRRAELAERLLLQFIDSAQPSQPHGPATWRVDISDEMMANLRMWKRAHAANFKGAARSVLKGGF